MLTKEKLKIVYASCFCSKQNIRQTPKKSWRKKKKRKGKKKYLGIVLKGVHNLKKLAFASKGDMLEH